MSGSLMGVLFLLCALLSIVFEAKYTEILVSKSAEKDELVGMSYCVNNPSRCCCGVELFATIVSGMVGLPKSSFVGNFITDSQTLYQSLLDGVAAHFVK